MPFKDSLLALTTYPQRTANEALEAATALAGQLGVHVTAVACEATVPAPGSILGKWLLDVPALVARELQKSKDAAEDLLAGIERAAGRSGVSCEMRLERCLTSEVPGVFVDYARLRDVSIVPLSEGDDVCRWYAEEIIFGSGRPTIVLPLSAQEDDAALETVVIAWDFSRPATRAVADSLPILQRAKRVIVVTVRNEKIIESGQSGSELARNLARHGVEVMLEEVDAAGRPIGLVLEAAVQGHRADLLVMGAFGHSRLREFILGGATKSQLERPTVPTLLSH